MYKRKYHTPHIISSSKLFIIPNNMFECINGGTDEPNTTASSSFPPITIYGSGNENAAAGTVVGVLPITTNATVTTYINANTVTGVSGGGMGVIYQFII